MKRFLCTYPKKMNRAPGGNLIQILGPVANRARVYKKMDWMWQTGPVYTKKWIWASKPGRCIQKNELGVANRVRVYKKNDLGLWLGPGCGPRPRSGRPANPLFCIQPFFLYTYTKKGSYWDSICASSSGPPWIHIGLAGCVHFGSILEDIPACPGSRTRR